MTKKEDSIQIFKSEEFGSVRTIVIDGLPWFVGKDVSMALGYKSPQKSIRDHVDSEDKGVYEIDTPGGKQKPVIINESGLYSLVFASKLPSAKKFKRWVTSEVLPSIRNSGMYVREELLDDPELLFEVVSKLRDERKKRIEAEEKSKEFEELSLQQAQQLNELQPKISYYDLVLQNKTVVPITMIAKDYGFSGTKMNKLLKEFGVIYKFRNTWLLYQKYSKYGYTQTKTVSVGCGNRMEMHTYWTQKGRLFIYDLLKENGILPLIEKEETVCYSQEIA